MNICSAVVIKPIHMYSTLNKGQISLKSEILRSYVWSYKCSEGQTRHEVFSLKKRQKKKDAAKMSEEAIQSINKKGNKV